MERSSAILFIENTLLNAKRMFSELFTFPRRRSIDSIIYRETYHLHKFKIRVFHHIPRPNAIQETTVVFTHDQLAAHVNLAGVGMDEIENK